jgi:phenylalanyl-tRNA synthetase alpha chain
MIDFTSHFKDLNSINLCLQKRDELSNSEEILLIKEKIKTADNETKKVLGQELNVFKQSVQFACDQRIQTLQSELEKDNFQNFDPSFYQSNYQVKPGKIHPISLVTEEIVKLFQKYNFDIFEGSQVESQWYNFTSVNTPDYHSARAMQDTFFADLQDEKGENYVLRTQVTSNAVKYAETHKPPFKVVFTGLVFRAENIDATHDINFHQFDCWIVDRKASISQTVTLIEQIMQDFFAWPDLKIRLRQAFFPFTNPSFEGDISCPFCKGVGCRVCKDLGWIEIFGGGLINPEVIKNMGLDPNEWQGLAFGPGLTRMAQFKLGVSGISQFYNGNLSFLKPNSSESLS